MSATRSRAHPGGGDALKVLGGQVRPLRERKPAKPRGPRKRENRSEYFKAWYAKNQARIIEKRRAERAALNLKRETTLVPSMPTSVVVALKRATRARTAQDDAVKGFSRR